MTKKLDSEEILYSIGSNLVRKGEEHLLVCENLEIQVLNRVALVAERR